MYMPEGMLCGGYDFSDSEADYINENGQFHVYSSSFCCSDHFFAQARKPDHTLMEITFSR
jgi:hypothetical protein